MITPLCYACKLYDHAPHVYYLFVYLQLCGLSLALCQPLAILKPLEECARAQSPTHD